MKPRNVSHSLRITNHQKTAKDSKAEQGRFTIILSTNTLNNLRTLIK